MIDNADKLMDKISGRIARELERARDLGWHEGVEAEKARARADRKRDRSTPSDAHPSSFVSIAFGTGSINERHANTQILIDLQADLPIDSDAFTLLQLAIDKINERGTK
jgi:hypothetical protein